MTGEQNERIFIESALDQEGNIIKKGDRVRFKISDKADAIDDEIREINPEHKGLREDQVLKRLALKTYQVKSIHVDRKGKVFLNMIASDLDENGQLRNTPTSMRADLFVKEVLH